jgi:hypothetical protein
MALADGSLTIFRPTRLTSINPITVAKVCNRKQLPAHWCEGSHDAKPPFFVRRNSSSIFHCPQQHVFQEVLPGSDVQTDDQIREYVSNQAWGHHATCTAAIGTEDNPMAVLDGRFRVRGVNNLRVVDASVFPRIPGFFTVCVVTMISEKARDVILADAKKKAKAES